jgi:glucuronate isomerase
MDDDFLLESETAKKLYHDAAAGQAIFDYHCHLMPSEIAENKKFDNLAQMWLGGDHYKWRMMRAAGIDEKYITGNAEPYEKLLAWARTVENLIGNPLYHWTHLELHRYFTIDEPLTEKTAPSIWKKANAMLAGGELSVKGIFQKFNVYAVGTTDDPSDSLEDHRAIACGNAKIGTIDTKVIPTFRPDRALDINAPGFAAYIARLGAASGITINSVDDVLAALENRAAFFAENGCRASDHGFGALPFALETDAAIESTFRAALSGTLPSARAADAYKTKILTALSRIYAKLGMVTQFHIGALRSVSGRMLAALGADTGYDAAGDWNLSENLAALLNRLESAGELPKMIFYSLNPKDYYPLATIMGGFQGGVAGKMQLGSGWWFCDHRDGMEEQLRALGNLGILPAFIGMLTDSRSFLSYPRHEYFRRILCNLLGKWVENGEYPADEAKLTTIVKNISFGNARKYFSVRGAPRERGLFASHRQTLVAEQVHYK